MSTGYKILIALAVALLIFLAGYFTNKYLGERVIVEGEPKVVVKYEKGDTIIREIPKENLKPYKVVDTLYIAIPTDTAALYAAWKDCYIERDYKLDFSTDTAGTFIVEAKVQGNEIIESKATIQPIIKMTEITQQVDKKKFIQGYVTIGTSVHNFNTQRVGGGVEFVERFDVGATVIRYNNEFTYTVDFGIKF